MVFANESGIPLHVLGWPFTIGRISNRWADLMTRLDVCYSGLAASLDRYGYENADLEA